MGDIYLVKDDTGQTHHVKVSNRQNWNPKKSYITGKVVGKESGWLDINYKRDKCIKRVK